MNPNVNPYLSVLINVIGIAIGNIIVYYWLKSKLDRSIESYKIAYSGIFKERIDIYKQLLNKTYALRRKVSQYYYFNVPDENEIKECINAYIFFYLEHEPFISPAILESLVELRTQVQSSFETIYLHNKLISDEQIPGEQKHESFKEFLKAGNLLKGPIEQIIKKVVAEMRKDLDTVEKN